MSYTILRIATIHKEKILETNQHTEEIVQDGKTRPNKKKMKREGKKRNRVHRLKS